MLKFNFRDQAPDYERQIIVQDRDDLAGLGCSDRLIDWLWAPNLKPRPFMMPPEDWFWRDREWFKRVDQDIVDEIHEISGGTFGDLSIDQQVQLLDIPMLELTGTKVPGARGKWQGVGGPVSVEVFAQEQLSPGTTASFA